MSSIFPGSTGTWTSAAEQPDWTAHLGPRPTRPIAQARWDDLAGHIAAYREHFDIDDDTSLLGPRPDHDAPNDAAWEHLTQQADRLRAQHANTALQRPTQDTDRDLDRAREEEQRRQRLRRQPQHGGPDRSFGPEL